MSFLKEFTMILSCSNISKSFGEKHILKQVSFHLEDHEKAAIVGINGAGKSTLLKIIIGELACDEGLPSPLAWIQPSTTCQGCVNVVPL